MPGRVGSIKIEDVRKIAEIKMPDLNAFTIEQAENNCRFRCEVWNRGENIMITKQKINFEKYDLLKEYDPQEALDIGKNSSAGKFDETVEVHFLGIDPRHADQLVRGTLTLPNGIKRFGIVVVTDDENADPILMPEQLSVV